MWVTVRASQPSVSIPTEITFWMRSPGLPGWPTVSTCTRSHSACSSLVSLRAGRSSSSPSSSSPPPVAPTASASARASAFSSTRESMCSVRSGTASSSMRTLPWTKAWWTRAAVSVRLATVIMTGGVGMWASSQRRTVSSQSLPRS
jgi:hypothetical protein